MIIKQVLAIRKHFVSFGWFNFIRGANNGDLICDIAKELNDIGLYSGFSVLRDHTNVTVEDTYSKVLRDTWSDLVNLDKPCGFLFFPDDLTGNKKYCSKFFQLFSNSYEKYDFLAHCVQF